MLYINVLTKVCPNVIFYVIPILYFIYLYDVSYCQCMKCARTYVHVCIASGLANPAICVRVHARACIRTYIDLASVEMVASASRRKAYQCLGVVAVLGCVLLISRHFSKDTVVILSSKRDPITFHDQSYCVLKIVSFILMGQLYVYTYAL